MISEFKPKLRRFLLSDLFTSAHGMIQFFTMLFWLIMLSYTDAYYVIYLLVGILGFLCRSRMNTDRKRIFRRSERSNLIMSAIFSFLVLSANYHIFNTMLNGIVEQVNDDPIKVQNILYHFNRLSGLFAVALSPFLLLGGMYCTYFILAFITHKLDSLPYRHYTSQYSHRTVFLFVFGLISVLHLSILLLVFYPGVITYDSINQITQCMENSYSNAHPVFHTLLIRPFLAIGVRCFNDITLGCALYNTFSVFLTSAAFSYAVVTLHRMHVDKRILVGAALFYLLYPNHILYSFTMWKDIPFSASMLVFTVAVFRNIKQLYTSRKWNIALIVISSLGICLFRGNGMIVLLIVILALLAIYRKQYKRLTVTLACVLGAAVIVFFPVVSMMDIEQTDSVELISIPIQQIGKTIYDGKQLTDNQRELISQLADIEEIRAKYNPNISDPLKNLIRNTGNKEYLNQHKAQYALMYLQIGLSHPVSYFKAYVDQTRGYWNAGYNYKVFRYNIYQNSYGIERTPHSRITASFFYRYLDFWQFFELTKPFNGIGVYTWLLVLIAYYAYRRKDKLTVLLTVPCLSVIFTLVIGTPVFADICYAYSLFCCVPFLIAMPFYNIHSEKDQAK